MTENANVEAKVDHHNTSIHTKKILLGLRPVTLAS